MPQREVVLQPGWEPGSLNCHWLQVSTSLKETARAEVGGGGSCWRIAGPRGCLLLAFPGQKPCSATAPPHTHTHKQGAIPVSPQDFLLLGANVQHG